MAMLVAMSRSLIYGEQARRVSHRPRVFACIDVGE